MKMSIFSLFTLHNNVVNLVHSCHNIPFYAFSQNICVIKNNNFLDIQEVHKMLTPFQCLARIHITILYQQVTISCKSIHV